MLEVLYKRHCIKLQKVTHTVGFLTSAGRIQPHICRVACYEWGELIFSASVDTVINTLGDPFPSHTPFISHESYSDHHGQCFASSM